MPDSPFPLIRDASTDFWRWFVSTLDDFLAVDVRVTGDAEDFLDELADFLREEETLLSIAGSLSREVVRFRGGIG